MTWPAYGNCARNSESTRFAESLVPGLEASARTGWEFVWDALPPEAHEGPFDHSIPEEITTGKWLSPAELTGELVRVPKDYTESFHAVWGKGHGEGH